MEFSGRGLKSQSGQLSIVISKNPSVVNTIYIYMERERENIEIEVVISDPQHTECSSNLTEAWQA